MLPCELPIIFESAYGETLGIIKAIKASWSRVSYLAEVLDAPGRPGYTGKIPAENPRPATVLDFERHKVSGAALYGALGCTPCKLDKPMPTVEDVPSLIRGINSELMLEVVRLAHLHGKEPNTVLSEALQWYRVHCRTSHVPA